MSASKNDILKKIDRAFNLQKISFSANDLSYTKQHLKRELLSKKRLKKL